MVPLERLRVDVQPLEVVLGPQAVEKVHRMRAAALEFDTDVSAHRRRGHIQVLDQEAIARERRSRSG